MTISERRKRPPCLFIKTAQSKKNSPVDQRPRRPLRTYRDVRLFPVSPLRRSLWLPRPQLVPFNCSPRFLQFYRDGISEKRKRTRLRSIKIMSPFNERQITQR